MRHHQQDALSAKSLINVIGLENGQTLMDEDVFQAIEEKRPHGLGGSKLMLGYAKASTDDHDLTNQCTEPHTAVLYQDFRREDHRHQTFIPSSSGATTLN